MLKAIVPLGLAIATISILLALTNENKAHAWHGQLGISGGRAVELWRSNPDDPAITTWRLQLQNTVNEAITACSTSWSSSNIPYDEQTKEQKEAGEYLRKAGIQHCNNMKMIVAQECLNHAVMQPIACEDKRIEHFLVDYCATYTVNQLKSCEDPKLKQKVVNRQEVLRYEKERIEAQKGTYVDIPLEEELARWPYTATDKDDDGKKDDGKKDDGKKDDDELKQKVINDEKVIPQKEEQELIRFCVPYFYAIDQPQSCEDLTSELKQKVEHESQKHFNGE